MSKKVDLDLDQLTGKSKTIKYGDKFIEISQPDLETFLEIMELADKMDSGDNEKEALEAFKVLMNAVYKLAPDLKGVNINAQQLFAVVELIGSMVEPEDVKQLREQGIEITGTDKKKE